MTPEQKIKYLVLVRVAEWDDKEPPKFAADQIDSLYKDLVESDGHWDGVSEVRSGKVETNIPCAYSRHYESKAVAAKLPDGSWVGWTYWYGGGKHGAPEEVDWMSASYDLACTEEEKVVIVRTFAPA